MTQVDLNTWEALDASLALDPATSDLTDFIGAIVDQATLDILQKRCAEKEWTLHTRPSGEQWYVTGYDAPRVLGKLIVGAAADEGHYHYTIKYGSPLYRQESADYKSWLWQQMKDGNAAVLAELYAIINGAYVGCDVYIDGYNAAVVLAAAGYLLNQYSDRKLPLFAIVNEVTA